MTLARLDHARETGALTLSEGTRLALLEPAPDADLGTLSGFDIVIQQNFKPAYDLFEAMGYPVTTYATGPADAVLVTLPRSRDLARGLLAQAEAIAPGGLVIVDGAKTDGIDAMLKFARERVSVAGQTSKAHGKVFWFTASHAFQDCALPDPAPVFSGWITQPGVFSADGPDAGSEAGLPDAAPSRCAGCHPCRSGRGGPACFNLFREQHNRRPGQFSLGRRHEMGCCGQSGLGGDESAVPHKPNT
jgi:16S rRNA (guanine1207-N2)-methyltransferase